MNTFFSVGLLLSASLLLTGCFKSAEVRQAEASFRYQCMPEAMKIFPKTIVDTRRTESVPRPTLANCGGLSKTAQQICNYGNQATMRAYKPTRVVGSVYDANGRQREQWLKQCVAAKMRGFRSTSP